MKDYPNWVVWKLISRPGKPKPDKIPINPQDGTWAKANDPKTWGTYEQAENRYKSDASISGLGFVFSKGSGILGIDIDHCFENGKLNNCAELNVTLLDSYTEISQSGGGLHIIMKADNPAADDGGHKTGDYEIYSTGRFFALTGNVYNSYGKVKPVSAIFLRPFFEKFFSPKKPPVAKKQMPSKKGSVNLSDLQIIELLSNAKNSSKFTALWRGSTSGYTSGSEADLALTSMISFYTQDPNQIQRLLLQSGLAREKTNRADYVGATINKALSGLGEKFGDRPQVCFFCKSPLVYRENMKCPQCGRKRKF